MKIYTVINEPDYFQPWTRRNPLLSQGSGTVVAGNRILTNAHVVAYSSMVEVRRHGGWKKSIARVLAVSHELDLALLTVDEPGFFDGIEPLELGPLPALQEDVFVLGFPDGGDSLCTTKGMVSRIEHIDYVHSGRLFLGGQIDAPINPGNSGGPVIAGGKIAGVAMQTRPSLENAGYMVPSTMIEHFLKDISDGQRDGVPDLGLVTADLDNPGMRRYYHLEDEEGGTLVRHVMLGSPAAGLIKPDDVLISVDGKEIAYDGTIEFRPRERTSFALAVEGKQIGEKVTFEILRNGERISVEVPLTCNGDGYGLVADRRYDVNPNYLVYGGIIFTPLTTNLLARWGDEWVKKAPMHLVQEVSRYATESYREPVVALIVFPDEVNRGYHSFGPWLVSEVNGHRLRDFDDFLRCVLDSDSEFVIMKNARGDGIVLDRKAELEARPRILEQYGISADRSNDAGDADSPHPKPNVE